MAKQLFKIDTTGAYRAKNAKKAAHLIRETVLLGDWEEVQGVEAQTLKPELAPEKLDGLILKGYEMKWGNTNENGEQYDATAFDEFIKRYFVDGKMNMPVDVNHEGWNNWHAYCGRVLYIEVNSVGFYFAVYVPRTYPEYDRLFWALKAGIVQGFSKEGFVGYDDYDIIWNTDGTFDHEQIHKMSVISVSLVCTPANGLPFEQMKETKNALVFVNSFEEKTQSDKKPTLAEMLNK
jgi:phage head maturation protease